jgi:hypothetical protein
MKTKILLLPFLLLPPLAGAQQAPTPPGYQPYQSPATVAKNLKAQCASMPAAQRPACESKARTEIRASINRHNDLKKKGGLKPPAQAPRPPAPPPRPPQK